MRAASELAGWVRPSSSGGNGGDPSSSGGSYPSALMQEEKGAAPQGSVRRRRQQQKQEKQEPPSTLLATAISSTDSIRGTKSAGATAVSSSRRVDGMSAGGTTRRWGYRRGPREQLRRNLFGRFAPVFFYPLAQVSAVFFSSYRSSDRYLGECPPAAPE